MAFEVPRMKLGSQGLEVSQQGLGCMGMSCFYGLPAPEQEMIDLIHYAVERGVTFLDTSDMYGPHTNEVLVGKVGLCIHSKQMKMITFHFCRKIVSDMKNFSGSSGSEYWIVSRFTSRKVGMRCRQSRAFGIRCSLLRSLATSSTKKAMSW